MTMAAFDTREMLRHTARDGLDLQPGWTGYETARDGVAALLAALDSQVIARELSIEFDDGTRLACMASGRRLVRLLEPAPRNLKANKVALFMQEEIAAEDIDTLGDLLLELCERGRSFTMSTRTPPGGVDPSQGGLSTVTIADALGLALRSGRAGIWSSDLAPFIERIGPFMTAGAFVSDGGIEAIGGTGDAGTDIVDLARRLATGLLSPAFPLFPTLETAGIVSFGSPAGSGRHTIVAGRLGEFIVAEIAGEDLDATLEAWRAAGAEA
jgi:hypothetical protein